MSEGLGSAQKKKKTLNKNKSKYGAVFTQPFWNRVAWQWRSQPRSAAPCACFPSTTIVDTAPKTEASKTCKMEAGLRVKELAKTK